MYLQNYVIKNVDCHIEVFDYFGQFIESADTEQEAIHDLMEYIEQ